MSPSPPRAAFAAFLMALAASHAHAEAHRGEGRSLEDDRAAFEMIKDLQGSWSGTSRGGKPAAVEYRVTAGGNAVLETLFPGTAQETVTLYVLKGRRLVLTHYGSLANQPRMLFRRVKEPRTARFEFAGGDNIDVKKDKHMHALDLRRDGDDTLRAAWTLWDGGAQDVTEIFEFRRKS